MNVKLLELNLKIILKIFDQEQLVARRLKLTRRSLKPDNLMCQVG